MSNEVVQWSKKVCYITKDDIVLNFVNKVKPLYIYPIKSGCILTAIKMSSDSFTEEVPYDRIVVARNSYDYYNNLYETTIEIVKEGEYSQCEAPDAIRGITDYYAVTSDSLTGCLETPAGLLPNGIRLNNMVK